MAVKSHSLAAMMQVLVVIIYQFEVAAVRYYCLFIVDALYKCLNVIECCMMYCYYIYRVDIMYKLLSIIDLQWLIFWCECISYILFWVTSMIIYMFSWLSWLLMIMSCFAQLDLRVTR